MKKFLSVFLAAIAIFAGCLPAFAADSAPTEAYTIVVNDQPIDLSDLPVAPYQEGTSVMVPLRKIGEALGYSVAWDEDTGAIIIDDEYIQKATLFAGTATVVFDGRLRVINMSRTIENAVPTAVYDGCTYVPLDFFQAFFNDTVIDGSQIIITTSKCVLCGEA